MSQSLTNYPISVIVFRRFLRQRITYPARGDDYIMATKLTVTKESASKEKKATPSVQAPDKKGVDKSKIIITPPLEPVAAELYDSAKTASKEKSQPLTFISESTQEIVTAPEAAVEQAASRVASAAKHGQKWQEIRSILENLKDKTLREIRKSVKNGTEAVAAIEPGGDIYDQASSERDRELGLLLGDREREKIHSIDEALLRIDDGDYGICEECDEDIPLGRLKAMPFTRHCVKCKSDLEKLQAQTKRVEEERAYREIPLGADEDDS